MATTQAVRKPTVSAQEATRLYWAVQEMARLFQFRDKDRICCYGITVTECYALEMLISSGPMMLNDLAKQLYCDKSTLSRVVSNLEAKGYTSRSPHSDDARALRLEATPAGRGLHKRIMREIIAEQTKVLADLPLHVRRGLPDAIRRLARSTAECRGPVACCGNDADTSC